MYPRSEYEMLDADLERILDACKPVPYIVIGGHAPSSPQENANRAWEALGKKMGFDHMTVRPVEGKPSKFFSAVPNETQEQAMERKAKLVQEAKLIEVQRLKQEIAELQAKLEEMQK